MADDRKEYVVSIGGIPHTLLLDEATAKSYGASVVEGKKEPEAKQSPEPKNKARSADNK